MVIYVTYQVLDVHQSLEPALALEPAPNTNHPQQAWEPPPPGWIKLNVDAAVSESFTSIATVARNDKGEVIKIWAKPISKIPLSWLKPLHSFGELNLHIMRSGVMLSLREMPKTV